MNINKSIDTNANEALGFMSRHQSGQHKKRSPETLPSITGNASFYHHGQLTLAGSPPPFLCTAVLASSGSALVLIWKAKDKLHFFLQKKLWKLSLQLLSLSSNSLISLQFIGSSLLSMTFHSHTYQTATQKNCQNPRSLTGSYPCGTGKPFLFQGID